MYDNVLQHKLTFTSKNSPYKPSIYIIDYNGDTPMIQSLNCSWSQVDQPYHSQINLNNILYALFIEVIEDYLQNECTLTVLYIDVMYLLYFTVVHITGMYSTVLCITVMYSIYCA